MDFNLPIKYLKDKMGAAFAPLGLAKGIFHSNGKHVEDILDVIDTQIGFLDKMKLRILYGAKGDGITDDTTAINNYIDASNSIVYIPYGTYIYNGTKVIEKPLKIIGEGTLKTTLDNHDIFFKFQNTADIKVKGITFDDNLKGRTVLDFYNCDNVKIKDCKFTGYSAQYGHHATDSAIRFDLVTNAVIEENYFKNFGNQYDNTTATLNRCVTLNGTGCKNVFIFKNTFNEVNQGIVMGGGKHLQIHENTFDGVRDNCVYGGGDDLSILDNYVRNGYDEALVLNSGVIIVSNNKIMAAPNKSIGINGNIISLTITDNIFDNTECGKGQFIYYRNLAYKINNLIIAGNTFLSPTNSTTYEYFQLGDFDYMVFTKNIINVFTGSGQKVLRINGTKMWGDIFENVFICTASSNANAVFIEATVVDYWCFFRSNTLLNCRGAGDIHKLHIQDHAIQTNIGPYIQNRIGKKIMYASAIPTSGTWAVGDIVINTSPAASGYHGWECTTAGTPGTWKGFGAIQA